MTAVSFEQGVASDLEWQHIYEAVIPAMERAPIERLQEGLASGARLLHVTKVDDAVATFSILHLGLPSVIWLSYVGTLPSRQCEGWGAKHLSQLIKVLQTDYPDRVGLFGDIKSPYQEHPRAEEMKLRERRNDFYKRLGALTLVSYKVPTFVPSEPLEQQMLCIPFHPDRISESFLQTLKQQVLEKLYLAAPEPL